MSKNKIIILIYHVTNFEILFRLCVYNAFVEKPLAKHESWHDGQEEWGLTIAGCKTKTKLNSAAVVRKRTIPTERTPLVGEVSANLCG
jgi:hypothetical protein